MKKKITAFFIISVLVCQLCSCGKQEDVAYGEADGRTDTYESDLDAAAISELSKQDNSKDAYSAVINAPLRVEKPEGALSGGGSAAILGSTRALSFKKHLFEDYENCWDEIAIVTVDGGKDSVRREIRNQIWGIGSVLGTDHYVIHQVRSGYNTFLELDEENRVVREIHMECLDGEELLLTNQIMIDEAGYIHFTVWNDGNAGYYIATPEGKLLVEGYTEEGFFIYRLVPLFDGHVALELQKEAKIGEAIETREKLLRYLDIDTGEATTLAAVEESFSEKYDRLTLMDEDTLLYANEKGIYCRNINEKVPRLLYLWTNHGVVNPEVWELQTVSDDRIAAIYENESGMNYLCIEPTTAQIEMIEIDVAVSPAMEKIYRSAAARFNKLYPNCHLNLKTDYDETVLLTELIAGNGPVLIDTSLTGFDNQEKLWEPLDGILEQLGLMKELNLAAMELGEINGRLYGIVTDFYLDTVVTGEKELQNWNYETFLQCIADHPGLGAVMNSNSAQDGWYFISRFLIHGLEDNYLLDAESGTTRFDSREFREVLGIATKYCERQDYVYPGETMLEGKVLCNVLTISKPADMELYRRIYGNEINFIGFPAKDGSAHYLRGRSPLTIRRTAGKEEKEAACAFISLLLSYDSQSASAGNRNFGMSVRKDVLQEQIDSIAQMDEDTPLYVSGFDQMKLGDQADAELDGKLLHGLIKEAEANKGFPRGLMEIIAGEMNNYFTGSIDEETVIRNLTNRVELYLSEQQ